MVLVATKKRPVTHHEKKRRGRHHKRDPDYHKAYWPYLPMAIIVSLGVLANTFWGTIQQNVLSYATDMSLSGLLQETNEERVAGGLGNLALNSKLNSAAQTKADDMATRDYWSHNTPDGEQPWVFISGAGYSYQTAGENLAYGFDNSTEAVIGWMNSPGHKANIMNTSYVDVGFGIANAANYQGTGPQTIVVAMYGSPHVLAAAPAAPAPSTPAPQPAAPAEEPAAEEPAPAPTPVEEQLAVTPTIVEDDKAEEAAATPVVTTQKVSRFQLLSGATASWGVFAMSAIIAVAVVIFVMRHGLLLRRVLLNSEAFIHKHPVFDIALVAVITVGVILTRTDGLIR